MYMIFFQKKARAFGVDARKEDQMQEMFRSIEEEVGPIEVCIFNVGGNVKFSLEDTTSRVFYKVGLNLVCALWLSPWLENLVQWVFMLLTLSLMEP